MNLFLLALMLFLSGLVTDFTLVLYVQKVAEYKRSLSKGIKNKKLLREAAFWSITMGICSILMVEGVVTSFFMSVFWLLGLWIGTYFSDDLETLLKKIFGGVHEHNENLS